METLGAKTSSQLLTLLIKQTKSGLAQKYPVMVYIHGGDFIHGSSNTFPGHIMAAFYDVVVVTFNYRLGALGFLSTVSLTPYQGFLFSTLFTLLLGR
jgi:carboxylesterase type B